MHSFLSKAQSGKINTRIKTPIPIAQSAPAAIHVVRYNVPVVLSKLVGDGKGRARSIRSVLPCSIRSSSSKLTLVPWIGVPEGM